MILLKFIIFCYKTEMIILYFKFKFVINQKLAGKLPEGFLLINNVVYKSLFGTTIALI